jgi:O-acetylhomoserine (thiol)-lyase
VWADPDDIGSFDRAVTPHTKAIFIESIANPSGSVTDIEAISAVARKAGVPLIVDNTLATPYLIRPIDHGADIVVHSLTKFLGGHGNSIGGIISRSRLPAACSACAISVRRSRRSTRFSFSPASKRCRCGCRSIARMRKRSRSGCWHIQPWRRSITPGCPGTNTTTSRANMRRRAPARCSPSASRAAMRPASNVGDTRSLVIHPASTTHSQLDDAAKIRSGAAPDVVRLSIGIEDKEDLIADLEQALSA